MRRAFVVVLITMVGAGCDTNTPIGVPPAESCLTIDDVTNIPPGDATGSMSLGVYHAITNFRESCSRCDRNTVADAQCTDSPVDPSIRITFSQADGVLTAEGTDGSRMEGSINTDRSFVLGTVATPTSADGTQTGQGLALITGKLSGNVVVVTMTLRLTVNSSGGAIDVQSVHTVTWERVN